MPCTAGLRLVQSGRQFHGVAQKVKVIMAQCQHWCKQEHQHQQHTGNHSASIGRASNDSQR